MRPAPALLAIALLFGAGIVVGAQAAKPAAKPAFEPLAQSAAEPAGTRKGARVQQSGSSAKVNPQADALARFQANLQGYLKLREGLSKKLKPLSPTANSSELAARQDALAAALKQARKGAMRGDLIPATTAAQIEQTIAADFRRRRPAATKAVFEEVPGSVRASVNRAIPDAAALATMPPLLLQDLPPLPDNLQYRLLQRDLVLLDGDTRLIIDYIPNVLPAH